jgi:glycosyltransferase involved in cell wall biosynthesis
MTLDRPTTELDVLIDFIVRSDSPTKSGGDSLQIAEYIQRLERRGADCRIIPFTPSMKVRDGAIAHIVNMDRPFDLLSSIAAADGHPVVVSPIHHDLHFVRQMRLADNGWSLRTIIGHVLPEPMRELLGFGVRSFRSAASTLDRLSAVRSLLAAIVVAPRVWRHVGAALDGVSAVALLARGEGVSIQRDTGWRGRNAILVPNGHPPMSHIEALRKESRMRNIGILSVGRIELRKRQLEVAREALRQATNVVFVGPAPAGGSRYASEFSRVVNESRGLLEWRGLASHSEVLELMSRARVVINASWVEVQSLVDIEAAFSGCQVVVAGGGNSRESLIDHIHEITQDGVGALLREAASLSDNPGPVRFPLPTWSWDDAVDALANVYVGLVR